MRELLLTIIPVQTPLQHLLILLQSQLSPYPPTAFITLPWKDFLPVLTIINFTSLTNTSLYSQGIGEFCRGPLGTSAETLLSLSGRAGLCRLGRTRGVSALLEGEPRLWSVPGCSRWRDSRCVLDGVGEMVAAASGREFPGSTLHFPSFQLSQLPMLTLFLT